MDAIARELAHRTIQTYGLSRPATSAELFRVARILDVRVVRSHRLRGGGYYLPYPEPLIVVADRCGARVLAHELCHHLLESLEEGSRPQIRQYPRRDPGGLIEHLCDVFARVLCG